MYSQWDQASLLQSAAAVVVHACQLAPCTGPQNVRKSQLQCIISELEAPKKAAIGTFLGFNIISYLIFQGKARRCQTVPACQSKMEGGSRCSAENLRTSLWAARNRRNKLRVVAGLALLVHFSAVECSRASDFEERRGMSGDWQGRCVGSHLRASGVGWRMEGNMQQGWDSMCPLRAICMTLSSAHSICQAPTVVRAALGEERLRTGCRDTAACAIRLPVSPHLVVSEADLEVSTDAAFSRSVVYHLEGS